MYEDDIPCAQPVSIGKSPELSQASDSFSEEIASTHSALSRASSTIRSFDSVPSVSRLDLTVFSLSSPYCQQLIKCMEYQEKQLDLLSNLTDDNGTSQSNLHKRKQCKKALIDLYKRSIQIIEHLSGSSNESERSQGLNELNELEASQQHILQTQQAEVDFIDLAQYNSILVNGARFYEIPKDILPDVELKFKYYVSLSGDMYSGANNQIIGGHTHKGYIRQKLQTTTSAINVYRHRIVALMFLKNEFNLPEVHHRNGKGNDNNVTNLQWVSHQGNCEYAFGIACRCRNVETGRVAKFKTITSCYEHFNILKEDFTSKYLDKGKLFNEIYLFEKI